MPDGRGVTAVDVLIVGAGFAGIGMGIQLARRGRESFVIIEQADDVGGTWRDNRYPGVSCDIPSHLYSFSFRPNPGWSRVFAEGREIHAYLRACVRRGGTRGPPAAELRAVGSGMERRRRPLARPHDAGRLLGRQPGHRHRPAVRAEDPADQEPGRVRRTLVALGPLEREGVPGRQAGRPGRHRRLGDPDPAPAGGRGERGRGLPAFRPVHPAARRPGVQPGGDGALRGRPGNRHRAPGRAVRRGRTRHRGPPAAAPGHRPAPPAGA